MYSFLHRLHSFFCVIGRPISREPGVFLFFLILNLLCGKGNTGLLMQVVSHFSSWSESGRLLIPFAFSLAEAWLWSIVFCHIGKRWLKTIIYIFLLLLFLVMGFLKWNFGMLFSPQVFTLLAETNEKETAEFIDIYLFNDIALRIYAFFVIAVSTIVIVSRLWRSKYQERYSCIIGIAITPFLLLGIGGGIYQFSRLARCHTSNDVEKLFRNGDNLSDPFSLLIFSTYDLHLASREMQHALNVTLGTRNVVCTLSAIDSLNIVVVIGESFIRSHSPLYGYPLQTTPYLSSEARSGRLITFTDVVSTANTTSVSLKNFFYCNSVGDGEHWTSAPFFPTLFRRAGYDVYYWDNQKCSEGSSFCDFTLNSACYHPQLIDNTYTALSQKSFPYDGLLIDDFNKKVHFRSPHNLILFHLMGQHFDASERYPHIPSFERFTSDSIPNKASYLTPSKRQTIAHYDNATLYNDFVLKQIINRFSSTPSIVVYFSDHGEHCYDYSDSFGRSMDSEHLSEYLNYQFAVPFVVWCSPTFKSRYPLLTNALSEAAYRPLMLDNVYQMLFHIGHIQTPYYHSGRDILSLDYHCPPRIVLDRFDYDQYIQ